MSRFSKFEEIQASQKAREVTLTIYRLSGSGSFARDFGLKNQICRASVSIMANIAEGHGRRTNVEFANFLNIARGSVAEVQSHLHIALGLGYVDKNQFEDLYGRLDEISRMALSLARYLRESSR